MMPGVPRATWLSGMGRGGVSEGWKGGMCSCMKHVYRYFKRWLPSGNNCTLALCDSQL